MKNAFYKMLYRISPRLIRIAFAFLIISGLGHASVYAEPLQEISISGLVTDANGEPLPGVNVIEMGTTNGTSTDLDGKFILAVQGPESSLIIKFLGYKEISQRVGNQSYFTFTLEEDVEQLEEVVVVGYGTQKKVNVTGSLAAVKGGEIAEVPTTTVTNTLAGRLPGVVIMNQSGEPGNDGASINIRGFGKPLILVDGVEGDFSRIEPNDIESISVLKDGAAAIYGARAGNGVVLVTTKRGGVGKPQVKVSSAYGVQSSTTFPEYADALQYMELVNDYQPGTYGEEDFEPYRNGSKKSTNWYDETFRKSAPIFKSNVNVSGGTEQVKYFVSYGFLNQASLLKSNDTNYGQHNLRSNINLALNKNLDLRFDLAYRNERREYPGLGMQDIMTNVAFSNPMYPAEYPDPSYPVHNGFQMGPNYLSRADVTGYKHNDFANLTGNFALEYKFPFLDGLKAKAFGNINSWNTRDKNFSKDYSYYMFDPTSNIYSEVVMKDVTGISLTEGYDRGQTLTGQFSLHYDQTFGKHTVSSMLLNELIDSKGDYIMTGRQDFISSAVDQIFASSALTQYTNGYGWQDGRVSLVGRVNYNYAEKYLLEFTFRNDASPRFNPDHRWGFFPSLSAGWRLSEEDFIKSLGLFDNLKIRTSYGESGFDNIGQYNFLTGYQFDRVYALGGNMTPGINTKGLANPYATWETMTMYNTGLEFDMWGGKFWGEFDAFYRTREGILGQRNLSLPSTIGATLPDENINSQNSRGFELMLGHRNTIGEFQYNISANVSLAKAKWDHYDEPVYEDEETRARYQQSGQWVNRYFGFEAMGLFTSQEEIDGWANQEIDPSAGHNVNIKPGDIRYKDINGDGVINELDQVAIGKGQIPEIFYGLNAGFSYKGLDFSMLWQGASGFNVVFNAEAQQPFYNNAVPLAMFMDRWTPENNDPNARFPRTVSNSGNANNYRNSSFWLQDGSYFRLKNLVVGYTIPNQWIKRSGIKDLRFNISGSNLFTFTDVYPYDPETPVGGRGWDYPQQTTLMLGMNFTF
ncbi:TonB-dependent receptor [Persicobacter diffluens]|uniref:SusC/RagA family TonB-linked outer membrane protein n=1 Tax=Persicobacter diffluens TaxID=981 RepID=A0AAN5AMG3_9BACT|nr:SusC/RagA family TonB-linked outer membrane protein [Persicobacter diffluens]